MVHLPQRRRSLEDNVADVAFGARPLAPRRHPTRTDSTATPRVAELRGDNARGQRARITDGEGAPSFTTTTSTYDPQRLWLTRLRTERAADGAILQDLQYSPDQVGNVIEIDDQAQQTHGFDSARVSLERLYAYDPLYRLSSATGREKVGLGQAGLLPFPVELMPHGGAANTVLRRTTQSDVDDAAGNLTETVHVAGGSVVWRRRAQVAAGHNQVLASSSGLTGDDIDDPNTWFSQYSHDWRGNMLVLPGEGAPTGMVATRDHRGHLESVALNSTNTARTTYDGAGQRIAKVLDKGQLRHTALTLWGIEHYTKHNMAATPPELKEERGTRHIMDDQQRIALVETRTVTTTGTTTTVHGHAPAPLVRFQLGDLLASACVELDGSFGVLSYPELHPNGTTAWWADDGALEVSKRYRFTGIERDEETGLKVDSQRYTCPWLGRWGRPDPIGLGDGNNRLSYADGMPLRWSDQSGLQADESTPQQPSDPRSDAADHWKYPPPVAMSRGDIRQLLRAVKRGETSLIVEPSEAYRGFERRVFRTLERAMRLDASIAGAVKVLAESKYTSTIKARVLSPVLEDGRDNPNFRELRPGTPAPDHYDGPAGVMWDNTGAFNKNEGSGSTLRLTPDFGRKQVIRSTTISNTSFYVADLGHQKGIRKLSPSSASGNEELNAGHSVLRIRGRSAVGHPYPTVREKWLFDSPEIMLAHKLRHMANNVAGRNAGSPESSLPEELNVLHYEKQLRGDLKLMELQESRWPKQQQSQ